MSSRSSRAPCSARCDAGLGSKTGFGQGNAAPSRFVQRFGGSLNLNVHFHMLALDGVYAADATGHPRFHPLVPPDDAEVARLAGGVARRIASLLERRGLGPDADEVDSLTDLQPGLASSTVPPSRAASPPVPTRDDGSRSPESGSMRSLANS